MDGMKCENDKRPTKSSTKQQMNDWLDRNGYPRLTIGGVTLTLEEMEGRLESSEPEPRPNKQPTNEQIFAYIDTLSNATYYTIYNITKDHGEHQILRTPPYHCELQPIEKIWAVVKNMVAYSTTGRITALELKHMLHGYFSGLERHIFQSVWETSINIGCQYLLMADPDAPIAEHANRPACEPLEVDNSMATMALALQVRVTSRPK
ncbi:hypothetical protein EC957_007255 [Mortierella hygrophila]|uniref:Uncharacterized protein n=1 Tax=Mortierella hygrophila TaxID=979708 RepID=A0A9P6JYT2_9FUNG|nr:hypothetical protein EC957_007255 [Mortierella hygrophila]